MTANSLKYTQIYEQLVLASPSLAPSINNEGRVFITTNEDGVKRAASILREHQFASSGIHMGVSGWHNFDIAALTKPEFIVLFDNSSKTVEFHVQTLQLLDVSATRREFVDGVVQIITSHPKPLKNYSFGLIDEADTTCPFRRLEHARNKKDPALWHRFFEKLMQQKESWLSSDESYQLIRDLARNKRIIPLHMDLCESSGMDKLTKILQSNCVRINTLYLSNVYCWLRLFKQSPQALSFSSNIKAIKQPHTLIIESMRTPDCGLMDALRQNIVYGVDPQSGIEYDPETLRGLTDPDARDFTFDESVRTKAYPGALLLPDRSKQ